MHAPGREKSATGGLGHRVTGLRPPPCPPLTPLRRILTLALLTAAGLAAPGTPENDKFNADMDVVAGELKKIQEAHIPVLWRPFHECSGNWFWWSAHWDYVQGRVVRHPELFKRAWKYMFDRLTRVHGLRNLIWVYNPNQDTGDVANWYPGDEYVDMITVDVYPPNGTHPTFASIYSTFHNFTSGRKVVAMSENGAIPDPVLELYDANQKLIASNDN